MVNARPHTARIVIAHLDEVQITRFVWHARSPDLNRNDHGWDEMVKRLRRHVPVPKNSILVQK